MFFCQVVVVKFEIHFGCWLNNCSETIPVASFQTLHYVQILALAKENTELMKAMYIRKETLDWALQATSNSI